jgi:hypothetical protein
MVNKPRPDGPIKRGNDDRIYKHQNLLNYFLAQSVGNLVKNIVITEVGNPINNFINSFAHNTVDVHFTAFMPPLIYLFFAAETPRNVLREWIP